MKRKRIIGRVQGPLGAANVTSRPVAATLETLQHECSRLGDLLGQERVVTGELTRQLAEAREQNDALLRGYGDEGAARRRLERTRWHRLGRLLRVVPR